MKSRSAFIVSWCLIAMLLLVSGCDFNPGADRTGCDGYPEIGRTLTDTTITLGDTLRIDLLADPPAFYHTGAGGLSYGANSSDSEVAMAYGSGLGGSVLVIEPRMPGTAIIYVSVHDSCFKEASQQFTVEVTAATENSHTGLRSLYSFLNSSKQPSANS